MSTTESLIAKLKRRAANFTYEELKTLMGKLGYIEDQKGHSSGSSVSFVPVNGKGDVFNFHKPHPQKEIRDYVMKRLIVFLKKEGKI